MRKLTFICTLLAVCLFTTTASAQQPGVPKVPGAADAATPNSTAVTKNLAVINNAFANYNTYGTVFSVQGKTLRWDSTVANVSMDIEDVTFYVNYSNKWIVIKCIQEGCFNGTSFKDEYSMSLKTSSGAISPEMHSVLNAFNDLRREILSR